METVKVSIEVMNKVLNVLGQLPYHQVSGVIQELQQDVANINGESPQTEDEEINDAQ